MTISPEAVQAALDAMRGYKPCRDEQQADHVVVVEGELMFPVFEGPAEACDKFRIGKALAAAFPIMLREVAEKAGEEYGKWFWSPWDKQRPECEVAFAAGYSAVIRLADQFSGRDG
jgi:hypothetical protein